MDDEARSLSLNQVPQACTLPVSEQPRRLTELAALRAAATAERISPQHLRLLLTGPADMERRVRDFTARERDCCSFFTFEVAALQAGQVRLDIHVPQAHITVLDRLAAQ